MIIPGYDMEAAVQAGVEYLDENVPEWWRDIDLGVLKMEDCHACIVGQSIGSYFDWLRGSGFTEQQSILMGFDALTTKNSDYRKLEEMWTDVVKEKWACGS